MAKLTDEQIEQIEDWAEKGKSGLWVSAKLGIPPATVNYRMLRAGYDPWPGARRHGVQSGGFSPAEDARMLQLARDGMKLARIAKTLGRANTSIRIRLMTLEVRAEKALEAAA